MVMLKKCLQLIGRGRSARWASLVVLALVVSVFEASSALLVFGLLGMAVDQGSSVALPVVGDIMDLLPDLPHSQLLVGAAVLLSLFFVVRAATVLLEAYLQNRIAQNAATALSIRLLGAYLRMPYEMHLRRNSSELIRNAYDSVQLVAREVLVPASKIISQFFIVAGLFTILLIAAPGVTLMAAAVLTPVVLLLLKVIQPWLKSLGRTREAKAKRSIQALQQSLQGMRDIKVLGRERFFKRDFAEQRAELGRALYLKGAATGVPQQVMETTLVLLILGLFATTVLAGQAAGEALSILGLFAYAALRIQPALNTVISGLNKLKFATPAIDQLSQDLTLLEQIAVAEPSKQKDPDPLPFERQLKLDSVSFRYDGSDRDVLRDVSFSIAPGESIGIIGPTGGGKTTLTDVVLGLLAPTRGRVTVDGVDVHKHTTAWQKNIGVVFQTVFLTDDTLRRNICLGIPDEEIDQGRLEEAIRIAQLAELVASLPAGLDTTVGERGVRLSGGQRQRVAIARALYPQPSVLVFDEGTASLDNVTEAAIIDSLEHLRGDRTLITVAHRLATVRNCDRILVVRDGRVADSGTYDDLLARNPAFRAMVGAA